MTLLHVRKPKQPNMLVQSGLHSVTHALLYHLAQLIQCQIKLLVIQN
uniref:Uncharacterized protein n=1 Tax=Arundo donax TaxID=35708 RepID=A0A0A9CFI7_ARUDO